MKIVHLKCQDCGGVMDVNENEKVIFCPYCGSKKMLIDSDYVKVQQIKKDVELGKQHVEVSKLEHEKEMELLKIQHEKETKKRENIEYIIIFALMLLLFPFISFVFKYLI